MQNRKHPGLLTARASVSVAVNRPLASLGMARSRTYSVRIDVGALLDQVGDGLGAVEDD